MQKPITITARHVTLSPHSEELIRDRAMRLEHIYPRLIGCSVVVEGSGNRNQNGTPYQLRIDLRVPGGEPIIVTRDQAPEIDLVVREGFDVAERQLREYSDLQRGR